MTDPRVEKHHTSWRDAIIQTSLDVFIFMYGPNEGRRNAKRTVLYIQENWIVVSVSGILATYAYAAAIRNRDKTRVETPKWEYVIDNFVV